MCWIPPPQTNAFAQGVVHLGLKLFKSWLLEIEATDAKVCFSVPLFIVDDEWLMLDGNAPPPHIMITIAKDFRQLQQPMDYFPMYVVNEWPEALGDAIRELCESMQLHLYRIPESSDNGAWAFASCSLDRLGEGVRERGIDR